VGVPAMAAATVEISVQFDNPALVRQLVDAAGPKTTSYRLESDLLVMAGEDRIHLKTADQGTLDLRALAAAK
jgi:hypothetical protein